MKKTYWVHMLFLLAALLCMSQMAVAMNLKEAKQMGMLGEQDNGYVGLVRAVSAQVKDLMHVVNKKRRFKYKLMARKNATSVQAIETLAGKKTIQLTPSGQYIKSNGVWQKK